MKKQVKKLVLSKETLRSLEAELTEAHGATDTIAVDTVSYHPEQCSRAGCN